MSRLSRAEMQEHNRARVLAAARAEFLERGYRDAKIDSIAERADLTRGAVYSNFPGKRALYFAVLAASAAEDSGEPASPTRSVSVALGSFARAWVARLPLATEDPHTVTRLGRDLVPEVAADERVREPYAQLLKLDALLLGLALERIRRGRRLVRLAEAVLTTLHGASQLAAAAPGFVDPFDVIAACEQLAHLDPGDDWSPPHLAHVPKARPVDLAWTPPSTVDFLTGEVWRPADGVVAILGLHRLSAIEEAVRLTPDVTLVVVTGTPDELAPLARLVLAELRTCLRQTFAPSLWPRLRVVLDDTGTVAAAAGVPVVSDATEAAIRVHSGRIVARADGYGACHAAATA